MPTTTITMGAMSTLDERFLAKVDVRGPDDCWPWTAGTSHGYGCFHVGPVTRPAHVVAYERVHGPVPPGLLIDHTCHNDTGCRGECPHRLCCNPAHLEAVTHAVNLQRGNKRLPGETCGRGHTVEEGFRPKGKKGCLACRRQDHARRMEDPAYRLHYNAVHAAALRRRRGGE